MNIILHIGTEKTGSTAIQKFIAANNLLLRENGFYALYDSIIPKLTNNLELVLAAVGDDNLGNDIIRFRHLPFAEYRSFIKESLRKIIDETVANQCNNLICTSEHLSSRLIDTEDVKALKNLFPRSCSFKIIVYFRKQNELLLGRQAERIKSGEPLDLYTLDIPNDANKPYGRLFFDYEKMLEMWASVFGEESIIVRPYEKEQLIGGDVIIDFLKIINLYHLRDKVKMVGKYNKRLSPEILFYLIKMKKYLLDETKRSQFLKILESVDEFETGTFYKNTELEKFYNLFYESNNRVAKKYTRENKLFLGNIKKYREFDEALFYKEDIGLKITSLCIDYAVRLKNKDAVIRQKDEQLKNKDAVIRQKDELLKNKDAVIQQQIQERERQLKDKDTVIQQLNQQIQGIMNSYSLRVGKILILPLSVLKKILLKLKNNTIINAM